MKRVEEASGAKIITYSAKIKEANMLMLCQDFIKPDGSELRYIITLAPDDMKLLIPEFEECIKNG